MDPNNKYTAMQQYQYDYEASIWSLENKDPVVGSFDQHNNWADYDVFLFKNIDLINKLALDFGCGPGRNIVKFAPLFQRIDGIDISEINLEKAKVWFQANNLAMSPKLFKNNGSDLNVISSDEYDIVFSTICFQHICVYDIRFNLLNDIYRVLKPGGYICFQMGFGEGHPQSAGYFDNNYEASGTNSFCDTRVDDSDQIKNDLYKIGFVNFEFDIRPTGPGDTHNNWIFFRAQKLV